jgi:hypothetical protein
MMNPPLAYVIFVFGAMFIMVVFLCFQLKNLQVENAELKKKVDEREKKEEELYDDAFEYVFYEFQQLQAKLEEIQAKELQLEAKLKEMQAKELLDAFTLVQLVSALEDFFKIRDRTLEILFEKEILLEKDFDPLCARDCTILLKLMQDDWSHLRSETLPCEGLIKQVKKKISLPAMSDLRHIAEATRRAID